MLDISNIPWHCSNTLKQFIISRHYAQSRGGGGDCPACFTKGVGLHIATNIMPFTLLLQIDSSLNQAASKLGSCISTLLSGMRWSNKEQQQQVEQLLMLTKLQLVSNLSPKP